jgi:hypothetical protein
MIKKECKEQFIKTLAESVAGIEPYIGEVRSNYNPQQNLTDCECRMNWPNLNIGERGALVTALYAASNNHTLFKVMATKDGYRNVIISMRIKAEREK